MRKKKIKILVQVTPDIIGGAEIFLFNLIKHIDKNKFEIIIFSRNRGITINMFKKLNVKTIIINTNPSKGMNKLVRILKKMGIDICKTNSFSLTLAAASYIAEIPHIWRIGGDIRNAIKSFNAKQRNLYLKIIYGISNKIVFPSQFLRKQFSAKVNKKLLIIHNGVEFNILKPTQSKHSLFNKNCLNIGMVAHLIPQKRHIDFIRAANIVRKSLPNVRFFIIGSPYPYNESKIYTANLKKIVDNLKLEKFVIFTGFIKDIASAITNLDIIVLPSVNEGSSNVIIEAMSLAKPIIASKSGANPEFIQNGINGKIVALGNHKRIAKTIVEIANNRKKAIKLGKAAKKYAKKSFDIRKTAKEYARLYEEIHNNKIKSLAPCHTFS